MEVATCCADLKRASLDMHDEAKAINKDFEGLGEISQELKRLVKLRQNKCTPKEQISKADIDTRPDMAEAVNIQNEGVDDGCGSLRRTSSNSSLTSSMPSTPSDVDDAESIFS